MMYFDFYQMTPSHCRVIAAAVGAQVLASGTLFTYGIFLPAFMKEFNVTESVASSPGAAVSVLVSATGKVDG